MGWSFVEPFSLAQGSPPAHPRAPSCFGLCPVAKASPGIRGKQGSKSWVSCDLDSKLWWWNSPQTRTFLALSSLCTSDVGFERAGSTREASELVSTYLVPVIASRWAGSNNVAEECPKFWKPEVRNPEALEGTWNCSAKVYNKQHLTGQRSLSAGCGWHLRSIWHWPHPLFEVWPSSGFCATIACFPDPPLSFVNHPLSF